jgi:hypothetical protein
MAEGLDVQSKLFAPVHSIGKIHRELRVDD